MAAGELFKNRIATNLSYSFWAVVLKNKKEERLATQKEERQSTHFELHHFSNPSLSLLLELQAAKAACADADKTKFDAVVAFLQSYLVAILVTAGLFALKERSQAIDKFLPNFPVIFAKQLEKAGLRE